MTASISTSEMAKLGGYDLSALLIQGATNANNINFASDARAAITSLRESVNSNIISAANKDKTVINQNTTNFAKDAKAAISSLRDSVNSNLISAATKNNTVTKQNTTNFASDARAAITALKESVNSKNSMTFAVKGDDKYDEDMDADSDGIVSYSEYIKYATNQGLERYNLPANSTTFTRLLDTESGMTKPQILNLGKALNSYLANSKILPQSLIQKEA